MTILEKVPEPIIAPPPRVPTAYHYLPLVSVPKDVKDFNDKTGKRVTLEEYWEYYYENCDYNYEYNDGILEAKPMAKFADAKMYGWFFQLAQQYLTVHPIAKITTLEIGFKFHLPGKTQVRKPDLGIVRNDNPIPLHDEDRNYKGKYDMCIEFVSDSRHSEIYRDTKVKFKEFQHIKVDEYFLLSDDRMLISFHRLNKYGMYDEVKPDKHGAIRSEVLPGFQFRVRDLFARPSLIELANDPIYQGFILPEYQESEKRAEREHLAKLVEQQRAEQGWQRAEREWQRAEQEWQRAEREHLAKLVEQQRAEREWQRAERECLAKESERQAKEKAFAKLRAMGINPDDL